MPVSGVDNNHIHTRFNQRRYAGFGVSTGSHCSANTQPTLLILASQRIVLGFLDIFYCDEASQLKRIVYHQHFLDTMTVQQVFNLVEARALRGCHQLFLWRHDLGNQGVQTAFKTNITTGHNANQIAAVDNRQTRNIVRRGNIHQLTHRSGRRYGDRILHDAALVFFDLAHRSGLLLDTHVLVDNPDAAFLCHGNSQFRTGNGIHRC